MMWFLDFLLVCLWILIFFTILWLFRSIILTIFQSVLTTLCLYFHYIYFFFFSYGCFLRKLISFLRYVYFLLVTFFLVKMGKSVGIIKVKLHLARFVWICVWLLAFDVRAFLLTFLLILREVIPLFLANNVLRNSHLSLLKVFITINIFCLGLFWDILSCSLACLWLPRLFIFWQKLSLWLLLSLFFRLIFFTFEWFCYWLLILIFRYKFSFWLLSLSFRFIFLIFGW
jgi:hypothetical protein